MTSIILVTGIGRETITTHQSNGSVASYSVDTTPMATGEIDDTVQIYSSQGGILLRQSKQAVSGNGLFRDKINRCGLMNISRSTTPALFMEARHLSAIHEK